MNSDQLPNFRNSQLLVQAVSLDGTQTETFTEYEVGVAL